jgi:FkbM family methyltransferase
MKYKNPIFIHTAKAAGGSINEVMKNNQIYIDPINQDPNNESYLNKEYNWPAFRNFNLGTFDYSFGFVRNTYDRVVSAFSTPWVNHSLSEDSKKRELNEIDFLNFIKSFLLREKHFSFFRWSHVMPFLDVRSKLYDSNHKQRLSFIGDFENLQIDFDSVCLELDLRPITLPHNHKAIRKHYSEYYNDEAIDIISNFYKQDIEHFGYQFQSEKETEPTLYNERGELIDVSKTEHYDRKVANTWISENDIVLELGSRFGICSTTINKKLKNKKNHVSVEPDEIAWDILEKNRDLNKCEFQILKGFVSKKKLSIKYVKAWDGYANRSFEDPDSKIKNYSLQEVEDKFNLKFNTLFADCEGFLPTFIEENPQVLDDFYKIIFEADYINKLPKNTYENLGKLLNQKGFTTRLSGHYYVYIKY